MFQQMVKTTVIRIVAFALLFASALPFIESHLIGKGSFVFGGGLTAAVATACAYLIFAFAAGGAQLACIGAKQTALKERGLLNYVTTAVCFAASVLFIALATAFVPAVLSVSSILAAVIAGLLCTVLMTATLWATSPCYRKSFCRSRARTSRTGRNGCTGCTGSTGGGGQCQGNCQRSSCKNGCQGGCGGNAGDANS